MPPYKDAHPRLHDPGRDEVLRRVRLIIAECLNLPLDRLRAEARLIEDLHIDSLDAVEIFLELESEFEISLDPDPVDPLYRTIFTRPQRTIGDIAELVFVCLQIEGRDPWALTEAQRRIFGERPHAPAMSPPQSVAITFDPSTQLGGRLNEPAPSPLFEPLGVDKSTGLPRFLRRTDGMRCVALPGGVAWVGGDAGMVDERPAHEVELSPFVIDLEPVSVTAYARFLNSIDPSSDVLSEEVLRDWFTLAPDDRRKVHLPLERKDEEGWQPRPPAAHWPMILVSWYGANAYSLWANGLDWTKYHDTHLLRPGLSTLPSEAQWEYAARGPGATIFPWGNEAPAPGLARFGCHQPGDWPAFNEMPLAAVHARMGVSSFGLLHMAGNVWQWCADWYSPDFYQSALSRSLDPVNAEPTGVRSERGGSWVGGAMLLRSSYRRARAPHARGRCLGFRCVSALSSAPGQG